MSSDLTTTTAIPGELIQLPETGVAQFFDEKMLDAMSTGGWLKRMQLFGGNSDACKEGKIGIAHFGLAGSKNDDIIDLGISVNFIPLAIRFCAIRFKTPDGSVPSYYDPNSAEFKQVMSDSEEQDSNCAYGPQFLIWLPEAPTPSFATFLFGNKSSRKEAKNLKPYIRRGATMRAKLVTTPQYKWHVPIVLGCSTPLAVPDPTEATEQINKFNNPGKSAVELAPEPQPAADGQPARVQ